MLRELGLQVTYPFARKIAKRFVAGETQEQALEAVRSLNAGGLRATIDFLGEHVSDFQQTVEVQTQYLGLLNNIRQEKLDANISVKPTQIGLNLDQILYLTNVSGIASYAANLGNFVRLDMESSKFTQPTLETFYNLHEFYDNIGVVIQASLRRSEQDIEALISRKVRVRLCKGAYKEPCDIAFPKKPDVDLNYKKLMEELLMFGDFPAIATHDERLIDHAKAFTKRHGIAPDRFEFQMLYGIRRDLQTKLVSEGYGVRIYVPYGTDWYPYLLRRLAERPANVLFLLTSLAKEGVK